jgi:threonine dehydrogenase-like Zn-dependent dehydrogenase
MTVTTITPAHEVLSLPDTMKAVELIAPLTPTLSTIPVPPVPADGLLLKTRCVSICSTDVSYFEGHLYPDTYPIILGHEYLGEVAAIGPRFENTADVRLGDRIVYWGQTDFGGFAEYRSVRPIFSGQVGSDVFWADRYFHDDRMASAVKVPDDLDDLHASLLEPTTGAMRSVLTNPPAPGSRVAVLGAGPIGVIAGSIIKRLFAPHQVISVDLNKDRNAFAERQFSDHAYVPEEFIETVPINSIDYVFDTLPTVHVEDDEHDPRRAAMRKLIPRGKYVLYGASQEMQKFDTWLMLAKGINITAAPFDVHAFPMHRSADVLASAVHMLRSGIVDAAALQTQVCRFADYEQLIGILRSYRSTHHLKTVVDFR